MKNKGHVISVVKTGGIGEELELKKGDRLLSINGTEIKDIFDYRYLINDEQLTLEVVTAEGEEWELDIEKDFDEDLGIEFESGLMDDYRSCCNKCIFCFIDQMPPGMRETLYFKDDDARLSFLQGNYVTLTNMSEEDVERICFYKLSPINVSIHTTNRELRCRMLNNRFAGKALDKLDKLCENGIDINGQIVLCKGYNDGEELDRTLKEVEKYLPNLKSISVVPVGLTKYRDKLKKLEPFSEEEALCVLGQISKWQDYYQRKYNTRLVYAADEWYLKAGKEFPEESEYEDFPQIENGVGMTRSLLTEFDDILSDGIPDLYEGTMSIVTGVLIEPVIRKMADRIMTVSDKIKINVYGIENDFFGHEITVAGLITGQDVIKQLHGREIGDYLLIPDVMLRSGEEVLLDDLSITDLENALQTRTRIVQSTGMGFVKSLCK